MRFCKLAMAAGLIQSALIAGSGPTIVLNEILVNANGPTNDGNVFVSIRTLPGIDLSGYKLQQFHHTTCGAQPLVSVIFPPGSVVPQSKVFIVADMTASNITFIPGPQLVSQNFDLSSAPGTSIVLRDPLDNIVDVVGLGELADFPPNCPSTSEQFETQPAKMPAEGCSVKRICDGPGCEFTGIPQTSALYPPGGLADTQNNSIDLFLNCAPLSGKHPMALLGRPSGSSSSGSTTTTASASTGASVEITCESPCDGGKAYLVMGLGSPVPSPTGLPIDAFTLALLPYVNTPGLDNFAGSLAPNGKATNINLIVPPIPSLPVPVDLYFYSIQPIKVTANMTNYLKLTITP